jgi:hypothetical protein
MQKVLDDGTRTLLSLSSKELAALTSAVHHACDAAQFTSDEYTATFGIAREAMHALHASLCGEVHPGRQASELVEAWEDQGAVMVRAMNTFGDPVELGELAAGEFSEQLQQAIREAS